MVTTFNSKAHIQELSDLLMGWRHSHTETDAHAYIQSYTNLNPDTFQRFAEVLHLDIGDDNESPFSFTNGMIFIFTQGFVQSEVSLNLLKV